MGPGHLGRATSHQPIRAIPELAEWLLLPVAAADAAALLSNRSAPQQRTAASHCCKKTRPDCLGTATSLHPTRAAPELALPYCNREIESNNTRPQIRNARC